ncbi:MAG: hypothetical protein IJM83_02595 [Firmicutes bacterium]|nr:hypothetical protein [Bacillota bacterium]
MYNWIEQRKGRNYRHESLPGPRKEPIRSDSWVVSTRSSRQDDQTYLIKQLRQMQMMIDIFSEILHLRDGTDRDTLAGLSPEEATKVIDRLRDRYSLMELTETLGLKRSSYHYQKALSTKQ